MDHLKVYLSYNLQSKIKILQDERACQQLSNDVCFMLNKFHMRKLSVIEVSTIKVKNGKNIYMVWKKINKSWYQNIG